MKQMSTTTADTELTPDQKKRIALVLLRSYDGPLDFLEDYRQEFLLRPTKRKVKGENRADLG